MADPQTKRRSVQVPLFLAILVPLASVLLALWTLSLVYDRNPLPFPDRNYHVFSASSADLGKSAVAAALKIRPVTGDV